MLAQRAMDAIKDVLAAAGNLGSASMTRDEIFVKVKELMRVQRKTITRSFDIESSSAMHVYIGCSVQSPLLVAFAPRRQMHLC